MVSCAHLFCTYVLIRYMCVMKNWIGWEEGITAFAHTLALCTEHIEMDQVYSVLGYDVPW